MENDEQDDMHIKIQKGSLDGVTNNKGSSRALAQYLNHEDAERMEKGLLPFPFTDPDGEEFTTEEVIQAIDDNAKGLGKNDNKFFHVVVAPSKEEIEAMGDDEQEVYHGALYLIKLISRAYAQNFHREGVDDESDLVIYWKPHFTRGDDGYLQFHLHAIVSRMTKGMDGKKRKKISPLTTHRKDAEGPINGGFDRNEFVEAGEKLFDQFIGFERSVAKSFEYQNTLVHGSVEEKASQADRLAQETLAEMKETIAENIKQNEESPILEVSEEDNEILAATMEITNEKQQILDIFRNGEKQIAVYLNLAAMGITCSIDTSEDGIEGITLEKNGIAVAIEDVFDEREQLAIYSDVKRLTRREFGKIVREKRALEAAKKNVTQRHHGGPKRER